MNQFSKQAMGNALKRLLEKRPLDHITVQNVADEAQVSRNTFYYHFHDIYDLVEWLLVEECRTFVTDQSTKEFWVRDIAAALDYAPENRVWLKNIIQSVEWPQLERLLNRILAPRVAAAFDQALAGRTVCVEDRQFVLDILTYGTTGLFLSWAEAGMPHDVAFLQDKLIRFFGDSVQYMADRCAEEAEPGQN